MAINENYKKNFTTMLLAAAHGDLALVECTDKKTGKSVITACAIQAEEDGSICMVPFAKMFDGSPFDELDPPDEPPGSET